MPFRPVALNKMGLATDTFLSALLPMVDVAPRDLLARAIRQRKALRNLRKLPQSPFPTLDTFPPLNVAILPRENSTLS